MRDARERVGDHQRLELELTRIGHVRKQAAAAQRIAGRFPPIRRRLLDRHRLCVGGAFRDALDSCGDTLARDCAADQDDLAVGSCDHPPAGGGFFDHQRHDLAGFEHEVSEECSAGECSARLQACWVQRA